MDSAPSRRRARLVLLPDSRASDASELPSSSDAPGDGDEDPPSREAAAPFREHVSALPLRPLRPSRTDTAVASMPLAARSDRGSLSPTDPGDALGPGLGQGLGWLGGVSIALLTLLVPLTLVVLDRQDQPTGLLLPRLTDNTQRHGSHNPSGLSSAGVGESPRRDTGRKSQ